MSLYAPSSIEPLESRIAPAIIYIGALAADSKYFNKTTDIAPVPTPFHSVNPLQGADPTVIVNYDATDAVGANFVGGVATPDTYYVKLKTGDSIVNDSTGGPQTVLKLKSGNVVAFFVDKNSDRIVDLDELTGLSLGKAVSLTLSDSIDGDVVTNFNDTTGKIVPTGLVGTTQTIASLALSGFNIVSSAPGHVGHVIAGGSIQSIQAGEIQQILTGTAANGVAYNFNAPDAGGTDHILAVALNPGQVGPGILSTTIASTDKIQASDGGAGATGGALTKITISADQDGFTLQAGNGGNGVAGKVNGGIGGAVSSILVRGATTVDNSVISIFSGKGGDGLPGVGNGGAAGKLQSVYVGYDALIKTSPSLAAPNANITVSGGNGGDGKVGGAGGAGTDIHVITTTLLAGGDNILVSGGNGGATTLAGGKAGAGGALTTIEARNFGADISAFASSVTVQAGNGGTVGIAGAGGGVGGNITTANLLGFITNVIAGNGSGNIALATAGGLGGNLATITLEENEVGVHSRQAEIDAGQGGDALSGAAGKGGNISKLTINNADFSGPTGLLINQGTHGNGGSSGKVAGGVGGLVSTVQIVDVNFGEEGNMVLRSGSGGNGFTGGGAAGAVSNVTISSQQLNIAVASGTGGSATSKGIGGKGGSMTSLAVVTQGQVLLADTTASILAGSGGAGLTTGAGGAGGDIGSINVIADGAVAVTGGSGGNGGVSGASGKGGSINGPSSEISNNASVIVQAGNAGALGGKAGIGGNIATNGALAATNITLLAGNGSNGGAGGNITNIGYSNPAAPAGSLPVPQGSVIIQAGNGSGGATLAGAGGGVNGVTGYVSATGVTTIAAGDGSASADTKKASIGGTVNNINMLGGGASSVLFTIKAGDAGNAALAPTGATGGSVTNVNVSELSSGTNFRSVAAGNGGLALTKGGLGGSITNVHANHEIGQVSLRGTFTLSFGGDTTGPIEYNASPTEVQNALNLLPSIIAEGGVTVSGANTGLLDNKTGPFESGGNGGAYEIAFDFFNTTDQPLLGSDPTNLTLTTTVDVTEVQAGDGFFLSEIQSIEIHLPPSSLIPTYGYTGMGGLFAGAGGAATTPGIAGSVTNITADSIASIVAGRGATPQLVTKVDKVYLTGMEKATADLAGIFTNMITANIVGSVVDPNIAGANVFKGTAALPIDGLVATKLLTANVNFKPQALTTDGITIIQ